MARLTRLVVPYHPHHITQRGNRRQTVFFNDGDYQIYLDLMAAFCQKTGSEVWAYCLMPNHVHMVMVPHSEDGLRQTLGEAHRRYTRHINFREKWRGYLWQGRFASFPMDEAYLMACTRYVELNPVRAKLVKRAEDWRWSSARAHIGGHDDKLVTVEPMLQRCGDWRDFLSGGLNDATTEEIRASERTGRPLGDDGFIKKLQDLTGRRLIKRKAGRPRKQKE